MIMGAGCRLLRRSCDDRDLSAAFAIFTAAIDYPSLSVY